MEPVVQEAVLEKGISPMLLEEAVPSVRIRYWLSEVTVSPVTLLVHDPLKAETAVRLPPLPMVQAGTEGDPVAARRSGPVCPAGIPGVAAIWRIPELVTSGWVDRGSSVPVLMMENP